MKQGDSWAGGQKLFSLWTNRLASAAALAALAIFAAPVAKADVVETFNLSGNFGSLFGSPVAYTGAIDLDFSNDFSSYTVTSINITVQGRSVFNQGVSLSVLPSVGVVGASNSAGDTLALWFAAPQSGSWAGFNAGDVSFGDVLFGGLTGGLFGANGVVQRNLSDPAILDPLVLDPPPLSDVPELSTWAMMLLGLAGLGLAAKRRRAIGFLGGKA
jgi:MYXO-CTERM domain-containing protein